MLPGMPDGLSSYVTHYFIVHVQWKKRLFYKLVSSGLP